MARRLLDQGPAPIAVTRARTSGDGTSYLFGKTVYLPGGHCGPRAQVHFQLVILISGSLRVTVNGTVHDLVPGDAVLQHPGRREFYRFAEAGESEHTWCQISPDLLSRRDMNLLKSVEGVHKAPAAIHLLVEEGLAAGMDGGEALHEAMAALSRACILRFAAHARSLELRDATPLHPALARALDIAASRYAELRSAEDLARRAGISTAQLRSLCRRAKRESPTTMIWRIRAEHAIQLIRSTGLTLDEIAAQCGYANAFHLSRSVKKHTGDSPRSLRQREWGSQGK